MINAAAPLIASTRMYNVAPSARAAWHRLLARVASDAGVTLQIEDHPHPATLSSLWERPDLGCAFMCGWPLAQEHGTRPVIAAPIPLGTTKARYHAVFVVRASSPATTVADTFGGIFAFNAKGSHSGWNMPRAYFAQIGAHYSAEAGPFGPHRLSLEAVAAGQATVAAVDSLVWDLLCRHAAALTDGLRVVGRTPSQPSPPLVGSAALGEDGAGRLRTTLVALAGDATGRALLNDVCLAGFAPASLVDYDETLAL